MGNVAFFPFSCFVSCFSKYPASVYIAGSLGGETHLSFFFFELTLLWVCSASSSTTTTTTTIALAFAFAFLSPFCYSSHVIF